MPRTLSQFEVGEKAVTKSKIITPTDIETFANITRNAMPLFLQIEQLRLPQEECEI